MQGVMVTSLLGFTTRTASLLSSDCDGRISVREAAGKGLGAFATASFPEGSLVTHYEGVMLNRLQALQLQNSEYLFELRPQRAGVSDGLYVDGANSAHHSRLINHDEHGNLMPVVGVSHEHETTTVWRWRGPVVKLSRKTAPQAQPLATEGGLSERIEFYAARPIAAGDELTFDYGEDFWAARDYDPLPESDSRVVRIRLKRALRWLNGPLRLWRAVTASLPL